MKFLWIGVFTIVIGGAFLLGGCGSDATSTVLGADEFPTAATFALE